ncbi:MAG: hypothetical protein ABI824_13955 [Acidobacteriota bacterium]
MAFAGNLAQGWAHLHTTAAKAPETFRTYWTAELLNNLAFLLLIISITARALTDSPIRAKVIQFVSIVLVAVLILPFVLYGGPVFMVDNWNHDQRQNLSVSQMLNFGGAIMSLGLWTALLTGKRRESQFLTVVTGLGVWVSGTAFLLGVNHFTEPRSGVRMVANYFTSITQLASLMIWCWAFWPRTKSVNQPLGKGSSS